MDSTKNELQFRLVDKQMDRVGKSAACTLWWAKYDSITSFSVSLCVPCWGMHAPRRTTTHEGRYEGLYRNLPRLLNTLQTDEMTETENQNTLNSQSSKKGDTRDDRIKVTEEFGNSRPDRVTILKHSTELTEEQTNTEQTDTLVFLDFCRSGGNAISRMRAPYEDRKYTHKDLQKDLACHNKNAKKEGSISHGSYAATGNQRNVA